MEIFIFFWLILLAVPFILPIVAIVSARRARANVERLVERFEQQQREIDQLKARVSQLTAQPPKPPPAVEPKPVAEPKPAAAAAPAPVAPAPVVSRPVPPAPAPAPVAAPPPKPAAAPPPAQALPPRPPVPPRPPSPPEPPQPPKPPKPAFDWEQLVGVKLFSAVAGIALVIGAVSFLKFSIDQGWLQPPVRVAIGVLVSIALLVVCELKAARRYPVTANAMDAAAIAILFATFFAAHALWNLIPVAATFGLLAIVTVIAVLLSIRRESLFIAVLGLLGGFAAPVLLSTGENRPIPLFAYLLLLNVGLAWVAYSRGWPLLTWLTLVFTVFYQWGWVFQFLDASSLPLAMGVFMVFPLAAIVGVTFARKSIRAGAAGGQFEQAALVSSALPVLFAIYLAAIPAYGAHAALLLGFLLLIDLGLLAIAIVRQQEAMHAIGAVTTVIVMGIWLATSYELSGSVLTAVGFTSAFVVLYLAAPIVAARFGRPFTELAQRSQYAAPLMLFVFAVLMRIEPSLISPWPVAVPLLALVVLIAWRAMAGGIGPLYHVAAFFAIATQAIWSATHLTIEQLPTAVALYTAFALISLGAPIVARRTARSFEPAWASGVVLLAGLGLLTFLAAGAVAPAALWALALLLAIMNAGLFIESASARLPLISQAGSVVSWLLLMSWWFTAAGSVGVLPSLSVMVGFTLLTLFGHGWASKSTSRTAATEDEVLDRFTSGLLLGLTGHLFLALLAMNRTWALPPWPIFGALIVITLGTSAAALWTRVPTLHNAGCVAAALVITSWSAAAGSPAWGMTVVFAAAAISAYAIAWLAADFFKDEDGRIPEVACGVVFVGELSLLFAAGMGAMPPFPALVIAHFVNLAVILALTAKYEWQYVAIAAVAPAWIAVIQWQLRGDLQETWPRLLTLTATLYALFAAYPFAVASRAREDRDPYLAAIFASAMAFFAGRMAFIAGGLDWMIGAIPVLEGAVLALMLRTLLRLEPVGQRDLGRLALVAGAALGFVTVAIPLQLRQQWITIGWALEGAALAWLYRRIPHRGLFYAAVALLGTVFVRLALNPDVLEYAPRGSVRVFNWYLYTYVICAASLLIAGWWLSRTNDTLIGSLRSTHLLSAGGVILLFFLLNIEIADFYATGATIMFRFGVTVSQDLTYTIGWLVFGMLLLAAGIVLGHRSARIAAVALIAITAFKCFLYDLSSLAGLYRAASFVGLAISLALVSLALQKFVLAKQEHAA